MTSSQSVMLTQAQLYADAGKRIFPLKVKEKQPAFIPGFNHGFKDATTSKEAIKKAWATTNFNIGLVTGEVNNLVVVDVDDEQIWRNFWANKGELPQCPKVTTGKGHHLYFAYPKGRQIRNKQEPGNGFDIRANGGYIVAPPSIHHSSSFWCVPSTTRTVHLDSRSTVLKVPMPKIMKGLLCVPHLCPCPHCRMYEWCTVVLHLVAVASSPAPAPSPTLHCGLWTT